MKNFTCVIVDDEPKAIRRLASLISKYCPEIIITGEYQDPMKALEHCKAQKPDIVFADVCMPMFTGHEFLKELVENGIDCEKVLVSAYADPEFTIPGYMLGVVNYILKPTSKEELQRTIEKVKHNLAFKYDQRISVRTHKGLGFYRLSEIFAIVANNKMCNLYTETQGRRTILCLLGEVEKQINSKTFLRFGRSIIVNTEKIKALNRNTREIIFEDIYQNQTSIVISSEALQLITKFMEQGVYRNSVNDGVHCNGRSKFK